MKYLTVAEARALPGLRLVLTAHMPGPWGEAAKAILSVRHVDYIPVAQKAMETNDELFDWTGARNAPTAVYNDEAPVTGWLDILHLAERLGSGPRLLPSDPLERALVIGLSTEICGPDGFGWSRRLELMGRPTVRANATTGAADMTRMVRSYGATPQAIARAPRRMVSIMHGLVEQLRRQQALGSTFLVGSQLSAADLYWAALSLFVSPLPAEQCAMPDFMRSNYTHLTPELAAALDPALIRHRDFIYRQHVGLPLDF